jgi:hypothetical protein
MLMATDAVPRFALSKRQLQQQQQQMQSPVRRDW